GEAMKVVAEANRYLSDQAPWKLKTEADKPRQGTILHTALQVVDDCKTMLAPFLPHSSQKVYELLGGTGVFAPMPEIVKVGDLDGGPDYPILTGDYDTGVRWESVPLQVGRKLDPPKPIFVKLDPSIVEEELARLDQQ
ncbi:MAG: methionine--tRNA ligase, partial [Micromonosporaceae bacterium]